MMELSHEDNLRLNVLLMQDLQAIKIDESFMVVYALTATGEAKVQLIPNCRDDIYLRQVRELFSTHVLGSPGGYPVYLKRWTRMRQTRVDSLKNLLLLGEPEAIVAVANATELTQDLACYAWWAMPTADIARRLLENKTVVDAPIGKELAQFLLEFLPFEAEASAIVDSVRLVLQADLISTTERLNLWSKAKRKSAFYVGFLHALPGDLPELENAHPQWHVLQKVLHSLIVADNKYAVFLCRLLSDRGQTFLATIVKAINKVSDQDLAVALLNSIANYFDDLKLNAGNKFSDFSTIEKNVKELLDKGSDTLLNQVVERVPKFHEQLRAMLSLACVGEKLADPIFAQTDAVGSVMRKKLAPVTQAILDNIEQLGQK